jgi:hypothetical protein
MNSILISLTIITLLSCQGIVTSGDLSKDSSHPILESGEKFSDDTVRPKRIDSIKSEYPTKKDFLGAWAVIGEQNAAFDIQKNRIIYPEDTKVYKYEIINDSIKIDYGWYKVICKVEFQSKDTMILTGHDTVVYYRFRQ